MKAKMRSDRLKQLISYTNELFESKEITTGEYEQATIHPNMVVKDENGRLRQRGLMPLMIDAINELDYLVTWRKINDGAGGEEEIPEPRVGLDNNFD